MSAASSLLALLRLGRSILVVTGAGVSTGSGIPDFRGPQGVWKRRPPVYFDDFLASAEKRAEYWDYKAEGWEQFRDARPNTTHAALVTLERLGLLGALVTQNIDGLHQAAGSSPEILIEVHGTNRWVECLSCKQLFEPAPWVERFVATRAAPVCACGGLLKFATVSFGQALDPAVLARASDAAEGADLVLALGSTLSVHPAASIPLLAARRGVPYAVVNRGPTDHDEIATLKIDGDVAEVLPPAVAALAAEAGL
jgi:NAD-dependent deacetylase